MSIVITKIKAERIRRGWSQQVLGFHAEVSATDISKIETGRMQPYPGQSERIAKVLGLRVDELQQPAASEAIGA